MSSRAWRIGLAVAAGLNAVNSVIGAVGILTGDLAFSPEVVARIPFPMWIPGLILGLVVGGSMLAACVAGVLGARRAGEVGLAAGAITLGWIIVQVLLIGPNSWLQATVFALGLLTCWLGWQVRRGDRVGR